MRYTKIIFDCNNPVAKHLVAAKDGAEIVGIKVLQNGSSFNGTIQLEYEDECLIPINPAVIDGYAEYIVENFSDSCILNVKCLNGETLIQSFTIFLDIIERSQFDVLYETPEPEPPAPEPEPETYKVVFGPNWPTNVPVEYNQTVMTNPFPYAECNNLTSISLMGFAVTCPLSGGNNSLYKNGWLLTEDTFISAYNPGYTLFNEISVSGHGYDMPILRNRTDNILLKADSYKGQVACFAPGEACGFRDGKRTIMLTAGQEIWLSSNGTLYNPFE